MDQSALIHLSSFKPEAFQLRGQHRLQAGNLFRPCFLARQIALAHHLINELAIRLLRLEIATLTHDQRQFHVFPKMAVAHLHAPIFIRLADVNCPRY